MLGKGCRFSALRGGAEMAPYTVRLMTFRDRLLATLERMKPVLEVPGVMVGGSQVPNLLEPGAESTLVVSQDVDLVVPVVALMNRLEAIA